MKKLLLLILLGSISFANTGRLNGSHYGDGTNLTFSSMTVSNNVLKVLSNGNVGIGKAVPTTKLDVAGTVSGSALQINGATTITGTLASGLITQTGAGVNNYAGTVSANDVATYPITNYYATAIYGVTTNIVGWSSFAETPLILVKKTGKTVDVWYRINGTSNATSANFTVPWISKNIGTIHYSNVQGETYDNGSEIAAGSAYITNVSNVVNLSKTTAQTTITGFTGSGTKLVSGWIRYESEN